MRLFFFSYCDTFSSRILPPPLTAFEQGTRHDPLPTDFPRLPGRLVRRDPGADPPVRVGRSAGHGADASRRAAERSEHAPRGLPRLGRRGRHHAGLPREGLRSGDPPRRHQVRTRRLTPPNPDRRSVRLQRKPSHERRFSCFR